MSKLTKISKAVNAIATNQESSLKVQKKKTQKKEEAKLDIEDDDTQDEKIDFDESFKINKKKDDTLTYKKLQLHDQILKRPDTYIGSVKNLKSHEPIFVMKDGKIVKSTPTYPDGLIRIFIEVVSNAIDNVWRSLELEGCTPNLIKIDIDRKEGKISVWNDGRNIPVTKQDGIYIPEMIFGELLTSSNYNDNEERKTSGRNGVGGKVCNIFSTKFNITIWNKEASTLYTQEWSNNMYTKGEPVLTKLTQKTNTFKTVEDGKNGFTKIEFYPDFKKFDLDGFTDDVYSLYEKIVYDTAMTVSLNKVKTIYNGKLIEMKSIKDYVKLYFQENEEEPVDKEESLIMSSEDCRVYLCPSNGEFTQVSFVNGINTKDGGVHVDKWCEELFRPIVNKLCDPKKKLNIDIRDVKKHFFIFIYASLDKPVFDTQSKTKLGDTPLKVNVKKSDISKLSKWEFMKKIEESLKMKEMMSLKNTERKKRGVVKVEGLDDANFAGQKGKAQDCILCITEGASAKTYVVKGMKFGINGKGGHDYIGVLPIRGKFLNVRNASIQTLINNREVKSIIQALGLEHDTDYTLQENYNKLRYGKLMLNTDADVDGFHISGLILNFIHFLFPSLLKREGFFNFMRVPIVKIEKGKKTLSFFFQDEAKKYIEENKIKKDHIKYYKGLGTANADDVKEDFGRRVVHLNPDVESDKLLENVFGKENTEFRKDWMSKFSHEDEVKRPLLKDYETEQESISDFINQELILFSIDDCKRSIPHLLDGLKESHRKVLYSAFKKNLKYSGKTLKVAQFAGYVAEQSNYHHGEQNLYDTITKLAQRFVGSNNIPLLFNDGMFGSRLEMGKDAANGRYIFTKLDMLTRLIFREEDDDFLQDREDDGDVVEKEYYVPIVPMVLVNGCGGGIGTGWSTNIPSHNLEDIVKWIMNWLEGKENEVIVPWFRNFKGEVKAEDKKVITTGIATKKDNTYRVTEIPLGRKNIGIAKYKEILEKLKEDGKIKSIKDNSTEEHPDFLITVGKEEELTMESLELVDQMSTNNMVLFDGNNKIKKYDHVEQIMEEFCQVRLALYKKRKEGIVASLQTELKYLQNKIRFILEIINSTITLKNRDEESLYQELQTKKYDLKVEDEKESYNYLLSIQVKSMTAQRVKELQQKEKESKKYLEEYKAKEVKDLWREELEELLKKYKDWDGEQETLVLETVEKTKTKKVTKK